VAKPLCSSRVLLIVEVVIESNYVSLQSYDLVLSLQFCIFSWLFFIETKRIYFKRNICYNMISINSWVNMQRICYFMAISHLRRNSTQLLWL